MTSVARGASFTYRFVIRQAGTWYHSHQVSHAQVAGGLFGALILEPAAEPRTAGPSLVAESDAVLSENGRPATGSPWWTDSLGVAQGDEYVVAFVADNPGVWMDHCHNLPHAAEGLMTHLAYLGVTTPYRLGSASGNEPE